MRLPDRLIEWDGKEEQWANAASMMKEPTPREKAYFEVIEYLNRKHLQGYRGLFNCGDLGIALIYWDKFGWNAEWFNKDEFAWPRAIPD